MKIEVVTPHGFCAGVKAALDKALGLVRDGGIVYCLHEIVHNEIVVGDLRKRGFVFVESVSEVPRGATVLFSAHGVSPSVRKEAEALDLNVVDATCPFVMRVHKAAKAFCESGLDVVVIGKREHAEVRGILGEAPGALVVGSLKEAMSLAPGSLSRVGVVSQTTVNSDEVAEIVKALSQKFSVESTAQVCNATKERQDAVKAFRGDALLVLGSANSSNTRRLCEVANCRTFRAGTIEEVRELDLSGVSHLGVTSGASTPEDFFSRALDFLESRWASPAR